MYTNTTTSERRLERRRDDRMVGGVAAALGRHLDIPVGVVRLVFVITAFVGGLGVVAYLTGLLLIPGEEEDSTPTRRWFDQAMESDDWTKKVGWGLITLAAVIVVSATGLFSTPLIVAALLVGVGVALIDRNNHRKDRTP